MNRDKAYRRLRREKHISDVKKSYHHRSYANAGDSIMAKGPNGKIWYADPEDNNCYVTDCSDGHKYRKVAKKLSRRKIRATVRQQLLNENEPTLNGNTEDKEFDYKWELT